MKIVKYVFSICLVVLAIYSCSQDDDNSDFVDSSVAPTNISANVTVTQDNTGLVTITPIGEGVTNFKIGFGDQSESVNEIPPGTNVSHIYEEGTYEATITANGLNGLSTTIIQTIVVSFQAPENLVVTIENDAAISKQVNITASADFAISYEVNFGDPANTVIMTNIDESVSFIYDTIGIYTITVTAMSAAIETTTYTENFEVTEIVQPLTSAPTQPSRADADVISFFSGAYTDVAGVDFFPNWSQSTTFNLFDLAGDEMLQYANLNYQGIDFSGTPIDASEMEYLHLDIWTADTNDAKISPISSGPNETAYDLDLTAQQWTSFDIPLSAFTDQNPLVDFGDIIQFKFDGDPSGGAIFVDNLYFYKAQSTQTQPIIPVDFESSTLDYGISSFGGPSFEPIPAAIINNPNPSGINTTGKVFEVVKPSGAQVWAGAGIALAGGTNFSEGTTIEVDVWSPTAGTPILYKMEDSTSPPDGNGNPSIIVEVVANTTVANQWETLSFDLTTFVDFNTSNSYDKAIVFPNFDNNGTGSTYYFDNIRISGATLQAPVIPVNFESTLFDYGVSSFGGPSFEPIPAAIITNPQMSGINTSGNVLEIQKPLGAQVWAGAGIVLAGATDFSNGTTVTVDVWSPTAGTPILYKMEDSTSPPDGNGNPSIIVEVMVNTTVANQWETLTFDLTSFVDFSTSNSYDKAILFPNFNNGGTGSTYYFDNIELTN